MYTILVTDSNELVTTVKERIMRKSKLVDNLRFITSPDYKGIDMTDFNVCLEYILPISHDYCSEDLTLSDELYKGMLEYTLPFDTNLTKENGDIDITLTFTKVDTDENGDVVTYVRKTDTAVITIEPISVWSDIIPDSALTAIDQRLIKADAMLKALEDTEIDLYYTKADNIMIDDENKLSLLAAGEQIGDKLDIGVPKINNGTYDGVYDDILDLDSIDWSKVSSDGGGDGDGDGDDDGSCTCHHHFIEL